MACRVGPYVMGECIGQGHFGKVKVALHEEKGVRYAMKIIPKDTIQQASRIREIRREIAIMKALNHRNIVNLSEVLASRTKLYIVMELVDGEELYEIINRDGEYCEASAKNIFRQLVDGVDYCHRRGVYHRNLKPDNILIDRRGVVKITDFGVSSMKPSVSGSDLLFTTCGTRYYCAPEVQNGANDGYSGAKTDSWSLGVILYFILTGVLPFEEDENYSLLKKINRCEIKYPRWVLDDARDLIGHLLCRNPDVRYSLDQVRSHPFFRRDNYGVSIDGNRLFGSSSSLNQSSTDQSSIRGKDSSVAFRHVESVRNGIDDSQVTMETSPDVPPQEVRNLASYQTLGLSKLVTDALPGKSEKRIATVCERLGILDIESVDDLCYLAEQMRTAGNLGLWLETKSNLPNITCMRLARFFYKIEP